MSLELVGQGVEASGEVVRFLLGSTGETIAGRGELPRHKRGAGYRYKREELDQWLLLG